MASGLARGRSWSGLGSRPRGEGWDEQFRRWRHVTQRSVGPLSIVGAPPAFDPDCGLPQGVEDFPVKQFAEALDEAILSRASRRDMGRLGPDSRDPVLHDLADELRSTSSLRRLRPGALRDASHSLRPIARARPKGQRRIHSPRLQAPSPGVLGYGDEASWWAAVSIDPLPIALELWRRSRSDEST